MSPRKILVSAVLSVGLVALSAAAVHAGEFFQQTNFGSTFFNSSPACPAKKIPTFESLVPIPAIIDPFEQDFVPIFCQVRAQNGQNGVKRVKGNHESELIVVDNITGFFESFPVGSGSFKTKKNGIAEFDFDIPTELFADGFESGDVSAWSYTRTDFTNRKKVDNTSVQCGKGASSSE